ncbi:MAG: MBL fold metallo-hydrolase [Acidobacteriota bacterium]|nr:MBL fold metallo-hydrolase [Acidobacteriota bacterium]
MLPLPLKFCAWLLACAVLTLSATMPAQEPAPVSSPTRVVLLGTGTPNADPDRWGPAVAIVAGGQSYLVDAGVGIVRRAAAAAERHALPALRPEALERVFITHLHSDHTLGLADLMLSPWVLERRTPLSVTGPVGLAAMASHIEEAWREDIAMRLYGLEPQSSRNYRAVTHEIASGPVYEDAHVRVEAVPVPHGTWPEAFAYRFQTADRVIVISGDTQPSDAVAQACRGCDVLMHEVYSAERLTARPPEWQRYHRAVHTSTVELAALATRAKPKLLVLYHQLYWGASDEDLVREIRAAGYTGAVVSGRDLEVY